MNLQQWEDLTYKLSVLLIHYQLKQGLQILLFKIFYFTIIPTPFPFSTLVCTNVSFSWQSCPVDHFLNHAPWSTFSVFEWSRGRNHRFGRCLIFLVFWQTYLVYLIAWIVREWSGRRSSLSFRLPIGRLFWLLSKLLAFVLRLPMRPLFCFGFCYILSMESVARLTSVKDLPNS